MSPLPIVLVSVGDTFDSTVPPVLSDASLYVVIGMWPPPIPIAAVSVGECFAFVYMIALGCVLSMSGT